MNDRTHYCIMTLAYALACMIVFALISAASLQLHPVCANAIKWNVAGSLADADMVRFCNLTSSRSMPIAQAVATVTFWRN